jgi:hypothetical protein
MRMPKSIPSTLRLAAFLTVPVLVGCGDKEGCRKLSEHLTEVVEKERGEPLPDGLREKMAKRTFDSCVADPPTPEQLECALGAQSTEAMKACDPEPE